MEMSNIPNGGFPTTEQTSHQIAGSDIVEQPNSAAPPSGDQIQVKRRPGRPKGSTKKTGTGEETPQKIKRPVGRPRKDGFPAGSVSAANRPRAQKQGGPVSAPATWPVGYGQHIMFPLGPPPHQQHQLQHISNSDDWALLCRTNPTAFLSVLLAALSAPNPVSITGYSLEEAFRSHLTSLAAPSSSNVHSNGNSSSFYPVMKTLWLPSSPPFFYLTASASLSRTPSDYRFMYWDPLPLLFNGILCPMCSSQLVHKGRITSGPLKIYDLEKPFFIIGCEYICRSAACISSSGGSGSEGRRFSSMDASIFRALPGRLQQDFPARLLKKDVDFGPGRDVWNWEPAGISINLWNFVRGAVNMGIGKKEILGLVECVQRGIPEDLGSIPQGPGGISQGGPSVGPPPVGDGNVKGQQGGDGSNGEASFVQTFITAYDDAWKVNNVGGAPAPASTTSSAGGASASASEVRVGSSSTPQPQQKHNSAHATPHLQAQQLKTLPTPSQPPSGVPTPQAPPPPPPTTQVIDYSKGLQYQYDAFQFFPPTLTSSPSQHSHSGSGSGPQTTGTAGPSTTLKRAYPFGPDSSSSPTTGNSGGSTTGLMDNAKRSPRHCCKCGSADCKGKGGRSFCTNGCQDCGKLECRGRNSRRPDKKCNEGWV